MGVQDLTVQMVVIVVIGVFFASFMDAIAGGGGIISVPTYLLAGLTMQLCAGHEQVLLLHRHRVFYWPVYQKRLC